MKVSQPALEIVETVPPIHTDTGSILMIDGDIRITLNFAVNTATVNETTFRVTIADQLIQGAFSFGNDNHTIMFKPDALFPPLGDIAVQLGEMEGAEGQVWAGGTPPDPIIFRTGYGVYPGDLNNDGTVNITDVYGIAMHWHETGPPRQGFADAWRTWELDPAQEWNEPDATYADADGNGIVDEADLFPIGRHWGDTHPYAHPVGSAQSDFDPRWYQRELRALYETLADENSPFMQDVRSHLEHLLQQDALPQEFRVSQNFPNPFNPATSITVSLPRPERVRLVIVDVLGREVRSLVDGTLSSGNHTFVWDGCDENGDRVASGVYFCRVTGDTYYGSRKMMLLR